LINKDNIMKMKRGSVLINTSRGGLIDTEALVMALRGGVLSGAGLDVLEEEGFVIDELNILSKGHPQQEQLKTVLADHELMQMDNVIISPHMGAQTTEALRRILITSIDNIKQFIAGTPSNVVKPK
jgi:D-lactate dehydrogenase